jgi:hypothetical protein
MNTVRAAPNKDGGVLRINRVIAYKCSWCSPLPPFLLILDYLLHSLEKASVASTGFSTFVGPWCRHSEDEPSVESWVAIGGIGLLTFLLLWSGHAPYGA